MNASTTSMKPSKTKKYVVVGAGLVGSLFSIFLRRKGYEVDLYEKRSDIRLDSEDQGRSINLVITSRGINALRQLRLEEEILKITSPVYGRMIHSLSGDLRFQPYGKDTSEYNYSVSRKELNMALMTQAEEEGVKLFFAHELNGLDLENKKATFSTKDHGKAPSTEISYDVLIGTDGAASPVRHHMINYLGDAAEQSMDLLSCDYKELFMPLKPDGKPALEFEALHIWPRGDHMLMALPNLDGSFTMTLYLPREGAGTTFAKIKSQEDVVQMFEKEFPDVISLMPNYASEFLNNPQGVLGTVRCRPWVFRDSVALMGDAAHAVVPFFGQGMNCGFEDCTVLSELMLRHGDDLQSAFHNYDQFQRLNGNAIADMALDNFNEMSKSVGDERFMLKKEVEHLIENEFPNIYRSRYSLVTYSLLPYSQTQKIGEIQKEILEELCKDLTSPKDVSINDAQRLIADKLTPFMKKHAIDLPSVFLTPN